MDTVDITFDEAVSDAIHGNFVPEKRYISAIASGEDVGNHGFYYECLANYYMDAGDLRKSLHVFPFR